MQLHSLQLPQVAFLVVESRQPAVDAAVVAPVSEAVLGVELFELLDQLGSAVIKGIDHLVRDLDEAQRTLTFERTGQLDEVLSLGLGSDSLLGSSPFVGQVRRVILGNYVSLLLAKLQRVPVISFVVSELGLVVCLCNSLFLQTHLRIDTIIRRLSRSLQLTDRVLLCSRLILGHFNVPK